MNSLNASKNRFDLDGCEQTMKAVVTTGNGGYDKCSVAGSCRRCE